MMRAFKLYTGTDNASHVLEGTADEKVRRCGRDPFQRDAGALLLRLAPGPSRSS
jgi:hypothetical protein